MTALLLAATLGLTAICDRLPCTATLTLTATVADAAQIAVNVHAEGRGWALVEVTRSRTGEPDVYTRYAVLGPGPVTAIEEGLLAPGAAVYALRPTAPWPTAERLARAVAARHLQLAVAYQRWARAS